MTAPWSAAIELGSASAQLLLTNGDDRVEQTIDTMMGGCSLAPNGKLRPEAIGLAALDRVADALDAFGSRIDATATGADPVPLRVVATAAARLAVDQARLVDLVSERLGSELVVLDAQTEARLAHEGARTDSDLVADGQTVFTVDIGGASTEFALGGPQGFEEAHSAPIGGSLLTAAYLHSDPPRPEELSAALSVVELHIDDVNRTLPDLAMALDGATVVALGATATVAAIEIGADVEVHGFRLTRAAVEDVFRTIATESRADRAFNPGLPSSRVDDIVGACAVLVETMRRLDLAHVEVSQRGLLDGVVAEVRRATM